MICSEQRVDLVPLRKGEDTWAFDRASVARLAGAHGEEIVRSFYIDDRVSMIDCGIGMMMVGDPLILCSPRPSSVPVKMGAYVLGEQHDREAIRRPSKGITVYGGIGCKCPLSIIRFFPAVYRDPMQVAWLMI